MTKKTNKPVASKATEVVSEVVAAEVAAEETGNLKTVSVKNISKGRFVQPSTNITLWPGETKPLSNDGWLDNQVTAGLLEIV